MRLRVLLLCVTVAACAARGLPARASQDYPARPLRLVVPFAPGGGSDMVARAIGQKLSEAWGQQVVVDNRGGGGGIIGTEIAAKSAPDGYTLLWGTSSGLVINPLLHSKLPYNVSRDFAPISMISINPILLVVNNSVPVNSVKELIALAKARPGQLNYASPGYGSPVHLAMEILKSMTGTDIVHVPYKGAGPALTDLIAGHVQMKFNSIAPVLPLLRTGRLKALAIGSAQRSRIVPDIPTMIEAGVPGFETVTWYGLFVPAKTPKHIANKLNAQIIKILADPEMVQRLANDGAEPRSSTPEGLATYMREEAERWKKAIKDAPPS